MNAAVNAFFLILSCFPYTFWLFHSSACAGGKSRQLPPDSGGSPY